MAAENPAVNAVSESASDQSVTALYVGDLDVSVTESDLHHLFGDVISVKICMDQTQRSLGYGYVNFSNPQEAARALEELNFTPLNGKPIRISYSNRDSTLRRSGDGNIFVKNLDKAIDHKALHEMFSLFGNIVSSKLETDASGQSKGYGFVQYSNEEAAQKAIEKLNGLPLNGKIVYVGPFVRKQEREIYVDKTKFNNVFVKNLSESTTEEDLKKEFSVFGSITSVAVMRHEDGNSKCFGFVNFENQEDAARSVELLSGQIFDRREWYVGRAQKKSERERELKLRQDQIAKEAHEKSYGLNNLYLKNLDDSIDNDKLKELFSPFGTIISCKVMCGNKGLSKGSGFVAFSTSQEATKARSEMNGKMVGRKPLYVAIAERKEVREARLQALFSNVRPNTIAQSVTPRIPIYPPGGPGLGQQIFYAQAPPAILPPTPGFGYQPQFFPGMRPSGTLLPNVFLPLVQQGLQSPGPGGRRAVTEPVRSIQQPVPMMQQQMLSRGNTHRHPAGYGLPTLSAHTGGMLSVPQEIGSFPMQDKRMSQPIPVPVPALASALTNASPTEQRTMLGENLYPLVEQIEHDSAAKVTGMLLEMDQTEVLHLLESPEALRAKVIEAIEVLRNVSQQQASNPAEIIASLGLE